MSINGGTLSVGTKFLQSYIASPIPADAVLGTATGVMYGFDVNYTPKVNGNISILFGLSEYSTNSTATAAYTLYLQYGLAPHAATNAATVGTQISSVVINYFPYAQFVFHNLTGEVSGLTVGSTYWFDVATTNLNTVTEAQAYASVYEF